jgi:carboxylesterase type B
MFKKLFVLVIFLFLPAFTLATSGACSWHDGVNCSVGASYDGKVICNDGWINSSVDYLNTDECHKAKQIDYGRLLTSEYVSEEIKKDILCTINHGEGSYFNKETGACGLNAEELDENIRILIEKMAKREKIFSDNFYATLDALPQYKGIADYNIIKSAALNPDNKDKTFAQIFAEAYPNVPDNKALTIPAVLPANQLDKLVQSSPKVETKSIQPIIKPSPNEQKVVAVASSVQEDSKPLINQQKTNSGSSLFGRILGFFKNIFSFNK